MKSIILSFLLLCLFPFVAFSRPSTTFISDNPIVLPTTTTTTTTNNNELGDVLDAEGEPLEVGKEYMIQSVLFGGGSVYLANVGNTKCPNGVVQDSSGDFLPGRPVKFYTMLLGGRVVPENYDVSIMFSPPTSEACVNETVWKVGYPSLGPLHPPPRFVVTGGTLGFPRPDNLMNWFKIEKLNIFPGLHSYKLKYCPSQYICPDCHFDKCVDIGLTRDSGYARLALNDNPYPFAFHKIKKNNA